MLSRKEISLALAGKRMALRPKTPMARHYTDRPTSVDNKTICCVSLVANTCFLLTTKMQSSGLDELEKLRYFHKWKMGR